MNLHFSSHPYYAAVSLASHQQVLFNFGQEDFLHPPKGVKFTTFYESIQGFNKKDDKLNPYFKVANITNSYINIGGKTIGNQQYQTFPEHRLNGQVNGI